MARESRVVAARFGPAYRRITDVGPNLAEKYPALWDFLSNLFYAPEWLLLGLLLWLLCVGAGKASLDELAGRRLAVLTAED
jgi:putative oxidoreductase